MSSIASYTSAQSESRSIARGRFARIGLATVVAAVIANTLFYYICSPFVHFDAEFKVLTNPSGAIIFTLVPAIVAVLLYAALLRYNSNPVRTFNIISAVVLVVSVIPDVTYIPTVPGSSNGQTAVLILMHIIAAAVITPMLTTLARPHAR